MTPMQATPLLSIGQTDLLVVSDQRGLQNNDRFELSLGSLP